MYYFLGELADSRARVGRKVSLESLVVPGLGSAQHAKEWGSVKGTLEPNASSG